MKTTLMTTFAFALMVFVFNSNPVMAGALSNLWSSNESVDELGDIDEDNTSKTAFGGWQAVLEACKDENGDWDTNACPYLKEAEGESEVAFLVCRQTPNGELVCCSFDDQGKFEGCEVANESDNESEIAGYGSIGWDEFYEFCQQYPDMGACLNEWQNEDVDSRDGFGGRDVADSGNEASVLEAGQRPNEVEGKDRGL